MGIQNNTGLNAVCAGSTVTLAGISGDVSEYVWEFNGEQISSGGAGIIITPPITEDVLVTLSTPGNSCYSSATYQIFAIEEIVVDVNAPISCAGESVTLTASAGVGATYMWTPVIGFDGANTGAEVVVTPPSLPFTYTVSGTTAEGCAFSEELIIEPDTGNEAVADFEIPEAPYCTNRPFELVNTSENATSYQWMLQGSDPALATTTNVTVNFLTASPEPYELMLIAFGCAGSDTITKSIEVFMTPILNGITDMMACPNVEVTLNASGNNVSNFIWEPDENLINSSTGSPTANISATTIYTVTGISDQGCESEAESFTVDIVNFPDYDFSVIANNTCPNEPITLEAASNGGDLTFSWTGTNISTPLFGAQQFVVPLNDTASYVLTASFANCQIQSEPQEVILESLPNATIIDQIDPNIVCIGDPISLEVESTEVESYAWFPTDYVSDIRGQNVNWLVIEPGLNMVNVEITGFNGCIDTLSYQAETNSYPETLFSNNAPTCLLYTSPSPRDS